MLIPLKAAIARHNLKITGIVHVGAHWGQELADYHSNGIYDIVFIEPGVAAFNTLNSRIGPDDKRIVMFNCACGEAEGYADLHVEQQNQGQSSSLLIPKKHLEYYPHIQFVATERVPVRTLDSLPFSRGKYNLLMMDTQGAELLVLKGATETLKDINYIYTEVNDQELYEGNAMVGELDAYLVDFARVETHWVAQHGWGDAIYIRKTLNPQI